MWCKLARGIKAKRCKTNGRKKGQGVITKHGKANWIIQDSRSNYLLQCDLHKRQTGWEKEEQDVSCPCMTLRKREETGIWRGSTTTHTLVQVMDLSQDRLQNEWTAVNKNFWNHLPCHCLASQFGGRKTVILRFQFFKDDLQHHIPEEQILHQRNCKKMSIFGSQFLTILMHCTLCLSILHTDEPRHIKTSLGHVIIS